VLALALDLVLLDGVLKFDTVADRDVGDQSALAGQDPGDPVEGVATIQNRAAAGGVAMSFQRGEPIGIESTTDVPQQLRGLLTQQPWVVGANNLPRQQRNHAAAQIDPVVFACPPLCGQPLERYLCPRPAGVLGPAGQPAFLPSLTRLVF